MDPKLGYTFYGLGRSGKTVVNSVKEKFDLTLNVWTPDAWLKAFDELPLREVKNAPLQARKATLQEFMETLKNGQKAA